jgi:hypothetical protein
MIGEKSIRVSTEPTSEIQKVAEVILTVGGVLCGFVLSYLIYHYSIAADRELSGPLAVVLYYFFPAVLAVVFLLSLQLEDTHKINAALLCLSSGISIYCAELYLSFMANRAPVGPIWRYSEEKKYEILSLARAFGVSFDTRSKFQVVSDLRNNGIDAVPTVTGKTLLLEKDAPPIDFLKQMGAPVESDSTAQSRPLLPIGGISNKVTVFCNESGKHTIYKSDIYGFRNPEGVWNSDRVQIATLGDSFTLGGCVGTEESFVGLIRERYPATLNLGTAGQGPLLMLAALREYAYIKRPKALLWFFYEDDYEDLKFEIKSPLLLNYLDNGFRQNLLTRQPEIDKILSEYVEREMATEKAKAHVKETLIDPKHVSTIATLPTLRQKLGLVLGNESMEASPLNEPGTALFTKVLFQANKAVEAQAGRLYFVYLPGWTRYGKPHLEFPQRDRILAAVRSLEIPVIDMHRTFNRSGNPLDFFTFRRMGHYNSTGHKLVAEEVLSSVTLTNPS